VRWKFNTLTRKYKDCVDNNKRTGTGAMTFKFFDHMENILGNRRTVQGQSTISSTFTKKNSKSKSSTMPSTFMTQSDTPSSSASTSSIMSTNSVSTHNIMSAKNQIYENLSKSEGGSSKNKQVFEKVVSSNTKTTVYPTSVSNTQKSKRPQHGSGSRTATSKMELEKQWLQHLKNLADKDKIKKEKQEAYEKRKIEEVQIRKKLIALKERQLDIKQNIAKRKQEETAEWHRDKLNIEKQKCRFLKELLEIHTSSRSKRFKTDSSYED